MVAEELRRVDWSGEPRGYATSEEIDLEVKKGLAALEDNECFAESNGYRG